MCIACEGRGEEVEGREVERRGKGKGGGEREEEVEGRREAEIVIYATMRRVCHEHKLGGRGQEGWEGIGEGEEV